MASAPAPSGETCSMEDHLTCSICMDTFQDPVTTACGHSFCKECLCLSYECTDRVCPMCKRPLKRVPGVNIVLRDIVQQRKVEKMKEEDEDIYTDRNAVMADDLYTEEKRKYMDDWAHHYVRFLEEDLGFVPSEEKQEKKSLHVCQICGWSKVTTYRGLRIHQGKKGCIPKGMKIPKTEQGNPQNFRAMEVKVETRRQSTRKLNFKEENLPKAQNRMVSLHSAAAASNDGYNSAFAASQRSSLRSTLSKPACQQQQDFSTLPRMTRSVRERPMAQPPAVRPKERRVYPTLSQVAGNRAMVEIQRATVARIKEEPKSPFAAPPPFGKATVSRPPPPHSGRPAVSGPPPLPHSGRPAASGPPPPPHSGRPAASGPPPLPHSGRPAASEPPPPPHSGGPPPPPHSRGPPPPPHSGGPPPPPHSGGPPPPPHSGRATVSVPPPPPHSGGPPPPPHSGRATVSVPPPPPHSGRATVSVPPPPPHSGGATVSGPPPVVRPKEIRIKPQTAQIADSKAMKENFQVTAATIKAEPKSSVVIPPWFYPGATNPQSLYQLPDFSTGVQAVSSYYQPQVNGLTREYPPTPPSATATQPKKKDGHDKARQERLKLELQQKIQMRTEKNSRPAQRPCKSVPKSANTDQENTTTAAAAAAAAAAVASTTMADPSVEGSSYASSHPVTEAKQFSATTVQPTAVQPQEQDRERQKPSQTGSNSTSPEQTNTAKATTKEDPKPYCETAEPDFSTGMKVKELARMFSDTTTQETAGRPQEKHQESQTKPLALRFSATTAQQTEVQPKETTKDRQDQKPSQTVPESVGGNQANEAAAAAEATTKEEPASLKTTHPDVSTGLKVRELARMFSATTTKETAGQPQKKQPLSQAKLLAPQFSATTAQRAAVQPKEKKVSDSSGAITNMNPAAVETTSEEVPTSSCETAELPDFSAGLKVKELAQMFSTATTQKTIQPKGKYKGKENWHM